MAVTLPLILTYQIAPTLQTGICHLSVVPVRAEPSDLAEMVTQLLFGDRLEVLKKDRQWRKIRITDDGYEGWIDEKQFTPFQKKQVDDDRHTSYSLDLVQAAVTAHRHIPIVIGSRLPDYDGMNFKLYKHRYIYHGQAVDPKQLNGEKPVLLEKIVNKYLGAPYLWGGKSPFGIDCSGFTQLVFRMLGFSLKRDAAQQADQGNLVDMYNQAKAGDLAFFPNQKGNIAHVGIILPQQKIAHAYGEVRIDNIDHHGIYNDQLKRYTHILQLIKRIL